jgi:hypothetical protein
METGSPEILATLVAAEFAQAHAEILDNRMRDELVRRIETALRGAMRKERESCVRLCMRRHALWESTESRADTPDLLRQEARCRANEAAYLADALAEARDP